MKNCSFSSHNHFFNKFFFVIWAAFHGLVLIAFLFYLSFNKRINIDSDLFNMLPAQSMGKALSKADSMLSEKTGRNVLILVSHEDFSIAKSTAESVYNSLAASPFFYL